MNSVFPKAICAFLVIFGIATNATGFEFSGNVSAQWRAFAKDGENDAQENHYFAFSAEPTLYFDFNSDNHSLTVSPFLRQGITDEDRTHVDLRQGVYTYVAEGWELWAGLHQVFWGVTESQHLVDVINQTDGLEGIDGEDKLGQPMVLLSVPADWGTLDLYLLPEFREREFASVKSRFNFGLNNDMAVIYESDDGKNNLDWAVRYQRSVGDLELGLSYFAGTSRNPDLALDNNLPSLYYAQTRRSGLDSQLIVEDWLWKLELVYEQKTRHLADEINHIAAVGGFEYTFYGIMDSDTDVGLLIEHHYDDIGDEFLPQYANDTFAGVRFALNDVQSTDFLGGIFRDNHTGSISFFAEASRRLGASFKLSLEAFIISNAKEDPLLGTIENNDYATLNLSWFF